MLYCYRAPLLWVGGAGLCSISHSLTLRPSLHAHAYVRRYATFIDPLFMHGDTMVRDDSTHLQLVTPALAEPVSLADAKQFLRIEHTADDAVISRAISAARAEAEAFLRVLLVPQTFCYTVSCNAQLVPLPVGPAVSITSITSEDGEVTLESDSYRLTLDGYGVIFNSPPSAMALRITFTAGLAPDAAAVPAVIKQGLLHHVAALVENRGGLAPMPVQALRCYHPYRRVKV